MDYSTLCITSVSMSMVFTLLRIIAAEATFTANNVSPANRLRLDLLENYDNLVRPVYNHSQVTTIRTDLYLRQLIDVDEKQLVLRASYWMVLYWRDEFLRWEASNYDGLTTISMLSREIWTPDVYIHNMNNHAPNKDEMIDFHIRVTNDGEARWSFPTVVETDCQYNIANFPFDTQYCDVELASWIYDISEVDIEHMYPQGRLEKFLGNVEWDCLEIAATKYFVGYNCCGDTFAAVNYSLVLKRKPEFYIFYLLLPSIMMVTASLFSFYLPPGSDTKVALSVTGLLSQTIFLLLISDLMPPDSHNLPILAKSLMLLLGIQALAVIFIAIMDKIYDDVMQSQKPPKAWMSKMADFMKYPLCLWHLNYKVDTVTKNATYSSDSKGVEHVESRDDISPNTNPLNAPSSSIDADQSLNFTMETMEILQQLLKDTRRVKREDNGTKEKWRNIMLMFDRIVFVLLALSTLGVVLWPFSLSETSLFSSEHF